MVKVVINRCFGGFGLSKEAQELYAQKKNLDPGKWTKSYEGYSYLDIYDITRDDPILVEIVETLGSKANGFASDLAVVEIPDNIEWHIHEYDGREHVAENHRTWR